MPTHAPLLTNSLRIAELATDSRLLHMLIVGKTGMGKSTLLKELAIADASAGHGFLLVDPHGDLAEDVIDSLPRRRRNDVVRFDATDVATCPGLNPLRAVEPEDRALVASNVISTMKKLWDPGLWGPRTEHLFRHALLALLEVRGATLEDARDMLVDDKRRRSILKQVKDSHVRAFWTQEFAGYDKRFASEITSPLLNKLGAVLGHAAVRAIVTRTRPRLDARKLLDRRAIVIASLPRGRLGEDGTTLLGGLLLGAFQQAALGRADARREDRPPFFILVDELGSFVSAPLLSFITEARKYGVGVVLATQSIAVLEPPVRATILGNVGTLVSFKVGAEDAETISREFVREVEAAHLQRLSIHECVVRTGSARVATLSDRVPTFASS